MKNRSGVWIFTHDGFWFVGIGRGYYNRPLEKVDAISQARQLARGKTRGKRSVLPIKVFGERGELIEQIV